MWIRKEGAFEGIVPNMTRRYHDTDSALVREELSRYRGNRPCLDCQGTRLRVEARNVRLGEGLQARTLHDVSHITLAECQAYFQDLTPGRPGSASALLALQKLRQLITKQRSLAHISQMQDEARDLADSAIDHLHLLAEQAAAKAKELELMLGELRQQAANRIVRQLSRLH